MSTQEQDLLQQKLVNGENEYQIQKLLGKGMFGTVYQAMQINKQELVAIKIVNMKELVQQQPDAYRLFQAEVDIQKKIKNTNVVAFIDYFERGGFCYLVQELCNQGDLDKYIKEKNVLEDEQVIEFFKQLVNGIKGMHEHNIIHRDLKLPNILIHNGQLKIADLGFAKQLKNSLDITKTILGTPYTMAPEVLEQKSYGLQADMFSLGVILYQMAFKGKYPFSARSPQELLMKIKQQVILFKTPHKSQIDPSLEQLIRSMLQYDLNKRIKWKDLSSNPIFDKKYEYLYANKFGTQNLYSSTISFKQNEQFYLQQKDDNVNNALPEQTGMYPVSQQSGETSDDSSSSPVKTPQQQQQPKEAQEQQQQQQQQQQQVVQQQKIVSPKVQVSEISQQQQPEQGASQPNQNENSKSSKNEDDKEQRPRLSSYLQNNQSTSSVDNTKNNEMTKSSLQIHIARQSEVEKTPVCKNCTIF